MIIIIYNSNVDNDNKNNNNNNNNDHYKYDNSYLFNRSFTGMSSFTFIPLLLKPNISLLFIRLKWWLSSQLGSVRDEEVVYVFEEDEEKRGVEEVEKV